MANGKKILLFSLYLNLTSETELKDQVLKLELHFNESTSRLETDLKQNKKAAAQQIIDISAKNKAYENEIEVFRARCADLENDLREAHDALENMKEKITVGEKGINIFIEKIESIDVYSMYAYVQCSVASCNVTQRIAYHNRVRL